MTDPSKGVKMNASVVAQSFRDTIKQKVEAMKNDGIGEFYKTAFYIAIYFRRMVSTSFHGRLSV